MSNKLIKEKPIKKPSFFIKTLKFLVLFLSLVVIGLISLYYYLHITEGFTIYFSNYNIQKEYARFLIEVNDDFIDKMVMFEDIVRNKQSYEEYTDLEKQKLSDIIVSENSILSRLANTPPTDANLDYRELHENITESYALYIQGQLMKMEYILQTQEGMDMERYTLGDSVTNLVGNFIIEYNGISNKVRKTNYEAKYSILDGFEYNLGTANSLDIERDEEGNILINEDDIYLYLPETEGTTINDSSESTLEEENQEIVKPSQSNTNIDKEGLNNFIEDFLKVQNAGK